MVFIINHCSKLRGEKRDTREVGSGKEVRERKECRECGRKGGCSERQERWLYPCKAVSQYTQVQKRLINWKGVRD